MNDQFESKRINICVAKLRNIAWRPALAITCVLRLDPDHFESQLGSPSFNQRLLNLIATRGHHRHLGYDTRYRGPEPDYYVPADRDVVAGVSVSDPIVFRQGKYKYICT